MVNHQKVDCERRTAGPAITISIYEKMSYSMQDNRRRSIVQSLLGIASYIAINSN